MTESNHADTRGLFDGFEGYQTPGRDQIARTLAEGLVVPDANVLLNLYRYTSDSRANLLSVLEKVSSQLWVPHQVLVEFWRNRESVMRDPGESDKTVDALDGHRNKAVNDIRAWANRVSLPTETADDLVDQIQSGYFGVAEKVRELSSSTTSDFSHDTTKDVVLRQLEPILKGRAGPEMDDNDYKKAVAEGLRRVDAQEPPGYEDKRKEDGRAAGDYLVWEQILIECVRRQADVILITGDTKEDWWRMEAGQRRGPRVELVQEMRRRTGKRFYMLRPAQLLAYAKDFLAVNVSDESVRDVELVDEIVSRAEEAASPGGGWTVNALTLLMVRLNAEASVQADAIRLAVSQSGFVSREQVYELGGYSPQRSLRGFTRPINRIAQFVKDLGLAGEDAVDILWTVYNEDSPEFGWAAGFRIHAEVLPVIRNIPLEFLEEFGSQAIDKE